MEFKAEPGSGFVNIELDGKAMQLKPSLDACIRISKIAGGLNAAIVRCRNLDFDTICEVVQIGLGINPVMAKKIPEAVYRQGTIDLAGACIDFVHVVANGGRALPPDDEEDKDEADPQTESSQ